PRLPRVLEAVRHRTARSGAQEALQRQRPEAGAEAFEGRLYGLAFAMDLGTMASYLVTGGAGFIGSHLSEELVRRGHRVRVADTLSTGRRQNLDHIPGVEFMEGDLADMDFATRVVQGVDFVLH